MSGILVVGDSNSAPAWIPNVRPWWQRLGDRLAGEREGAALVRTAAVGGSQIHLARGRTSPVPPVELQERTIRWDTLSTMRASSWTLSC